jgi:hypothetical protein
MLIPKRIRKRMGEIKRTVLILRRISFQKEFLKTIIEKNDYLHNILIWNFFKSAFPAYRQAGAICNPN